MFSRKKYLLPTIKTLYGFSTLQLVVMRHGETKRNEFKQWSGWHDS